ncbi:MAG: response regulator [candidate division Zixibacteria bacterium]|jgi:two-component system response regulator (stage 0 sporulation protein F)|nr:response regulator [candidate division Zixibacteria bacterium]MCK4656209.1 response regulator [candidate division Zixibacteria bacterium]
MAVPKCINRILIVDDTPVIRNLLEELLVSEGYSVVCATDGLEALKIIENEKLDLVFCDIHMPRKNGLDTLKESKDLDPELLFIMTDSLPDEMAEAAQQHGAISCISKPFEIKEIRECVLHAESIYSKERNVESLHTR